MIDVVYIVRPGDNNPELRYSLRSLRNLPHLRVWIVGYKPRWVTGVEYLPTIQRGTKWANSTGNILTACGHPGITDDFVYMNDDFFILEPMEQIPTLHRGRVADVLARKRASTYHRGATETADLLKEWGYPDPLSYELHLPMVIHGAQMADVIRRAADTRQIGVLHKRTLYGNVYELGGTKVDDCKIRSAAHRHAGSFLSTNDRSLRLVEPRLLGLFPDPSPYEVMDSMKKDDLIAAAEARGVHVAKSWTKGKIEEVLAAAPPAPVPAPPVSNRVRFTSAKGRTIKVRVGTKLHARLELSPSWTLVA